MSGVKKLFLVGKKRHAFCTLFQQFLMELLEFWIWSNLQIKYGLIVGHSHTHETCVLLIYTIIKYHINNMWWIIYNKVLHMLQSFSHLQGNMLYTSGLYWKFLQSVKGFKILMSCKCKNFYNTKYKIKISILHLLLYCVIICLWFDCTMIV
jgi:hypothetical protein